MLIAVFSSLWAAGVPASSMVEHELVLLLHQLCCVVSSDPSILELFFHSSEDQGAANFLLFSLLVPFIHRDGTMGQQARDALLLIMTLSNDNQRVATHIAHNTFFCPVSLFLLPQHLLSGISHFTTSSSVWYLFLFTTVPAYSGISFTLPQHLHQSSISSLWHHFIITFFLSPSDQYIFISSLLSSIRYLSLQHNTFFCPGFISLQKLLVTSIYQFTRTLCIKYGSSLFAIPSFCPVFLIFTVTLSIVWYLSLYFIITFFLSHEIGG